MLNEVERNLGDAMNVIRTIYLDPRLVPGGGATEMTLANKLVEQSKVQEPEIANAYRAAGKVRAPSRSTATRRPPTVSPQAQPLSPIMRSNWIVHVSQALEVIPRTLLENCGADIIRVLTQLRAKHAGGANTTWGIDGDKGCLADMNDVGVWEPVSVKAQVVCVPLPSPRCCCRSAVVVVAQTIKTAIESAAMLLRIDEIVSGTHKKEKKKGAPAQQQQGPPDGEDGG